MKKRALKIYLIVQALLCAFSVNGFALQGEDGSRDRYPAKREPRKTVLNSSAARRGGRRARASGKTYKWPKAEVNREPKPILVMLAVTVSPPDSTVLINGQKIHSRDQHGRQITNLEPGTYSITASKPGYAEQSQSVLLIQGRPESVNIILRPTNKQSVVTEQTPSTMPTFTPGTAMSAEISRQGKYIVVSLNGRSGNTNASIGSLAVIVSVSEETAVSSTVVGMLSGFPCRVDFVKIENIAEYSFAERPGPANQWATVVVLVRPIDSNRPVHFSINWKSLQAR